MTVRIPFNGKSMLLMSNPYCRRYGQGAGGPTPSLSLDKVQVQVPPRKLGTPRQMNGGPTSNRVPPKVFSQLNNAPQVQMGRRAGQSREKPASQASGMRSPGGSSPSKYAALFSFADQMDQKASRNPNPNPNLSIVNDSYYR